MAEHPTGASTHQPPSPWGTSLGSFPTPCRGGCAGKNRGRAPLELGVKLFSHLRCPARTYVCPLAGGSPSLAALWPQGESGDGKGVS